MQIEQALNELAVMVPEVAQYVDPIRKAVGKFLASGAAPPTPTNQQLAPGPLVSGPQPTAPMGA